MPELLTYLTEFGFAVLVTVYLLVRMEKKIENLTDSINELNKEIKKIER
jgi:hypothetical protein